MPRRQPVEPVIVEPLWSPRVRPIPESGMKFQPTRCLAALAIASLTIVSACGSADTAEVDLALTVGIITNNPNGMRNVAGFIEGMAAHGYVDGDSVSYLFAGEPVDDQDLDDALAAMVDAEVDLIFTAGTPTGVAAYQATLGTDIPVVFGVIADPIRAGVMDDLTQPGGNLTGVKTHVDHGRRLQLLLEMTTDVDQVFVPYNPDDAAALGAAEQISNLAQGLGIELLLREARNHDQVVTALEDIPSSVDAIFLVPDSVVNAHLTEILAVATAAQLPTSGPSTAQVEEGALTAFGFVHHAAGVQAARIAHQVLKGTDPGTLPVENTESFLAINLVTAESIGLEIADRILRQAAVIVRGDDA